MTTNYDHFCSTALHKASHTSEPNGQCPHRKPLPVPHVRDTAPSLAPRVSLSLPRRSTDYSYLHDYEPNSNLPIIQGSPTKQKDIVGVLKLNLGYTSDFSLDSLRSTVCKSNTNSLNDLSSVGSSVSTQTTSKSSLMSFKNI